MILVQLLLPAVAGPVGFRQHSAASATGVSARLAMPTAGVTVVQPVPRFRVGGEHFSVDGQLPLVWAWTDDWYEQGLGRATTAVRAHAGKEKLVAVGVEAALAPWSADRQVTTFGSHSSETQPGAHVVAFVEGDIVTDERATVHFGVGWGHQAWLLTELEHHLVLQARAALELPLWTSPFHAVYPRSCGISPHSARRVTPSSLQGEGRGTHPRRAALVRRH